MNAAPELATRVRRFVEARRVADDPPAFACRPGEDAELFGLLDTVHALHIVDVPDAVGDAAAWQRVAEAIVSHQDDDGWFRSDDRQRHHRLHVTAYALGALAIAGRHAGDDPFSRLRPLAGFADEAATALAGPDALSLLDRLHFWRGSHKSGGIAAIVGQVRDAGYVQSLLGIEDADAWLSRWARRWREAAGDDGLWRFGGPLRPLFYLPYRIRHREPYAVLGGAAHIYWPWRRLGMDVIAPTRMTDYILRRAGDAEICEGVPYCLDFDRLCLLEYALPLLDDPARADAARRLIARSCTAIRRYFLERPESEWFASSHRLPGALAALAVGERVSGEPTDGLRDVLEAAWWL